MYSKKYISNDSTFSITPPPGYDGSRFRSRSDGRDDAFPPYDAPPKVYTPQGTRAEKEDSVPIEADCRKREDMTAGGSIFPFLKEGIGQEELIIISLMIILVSEKRISNELILMLGLLLCI